MSTTVDRTGSGPGIDETVLEHRGREFRIAYRHRKGSRETLVYFHGLGSTRDDFRRAWDLSAWSEHTLLALDFPGCGDSSYHAEVPLGMDDLVAVSWHVIGQLGLRDLTLIGHSMGGLAGLLFALRYPASVRRLVSIEGNLGPEDCDVYSRRIFRQRFLGREREYLADLEREMKESEHAGFACFARGFSERFAPRAFFDYCRSIVDYSDRFPLLERFITRLRIPRLYVYGSENTHLTHIARLRGTEVRTACIPDSNHFPVISNPEGLYGAVADFIRTT